MSPKPTISREAIIEAAWELIRHEGCRKLNARNLADKLGTSTMPIYSAIGSMSQLEIALRQRVADTLQEWQKRTWGDNPMLDMATGYVMFAREEPKLYLFLFSEVTVTESVAFLTNPLDRPGAMDALTASSAYRGFIAGMAHDTQNSFLFRTWVFVHGLANLIAEGLLVMEKEEVIKHLEAAGGAFYIYHANMQKKKEGTK